MQVLTRDRRRCRICGRRPDDCEDVVLHVHHIRPWEKGGVTDLRNLITLCHTCHGGLEPHHDPSLFQYLTPDDPVAAQLASFRKGVANYRRVGFLSGIQTSTDRRMASARRRRNQPSAQQA
ncbi:MULTISPECIES: HNH endonuclease [unclassified Bradyrhizobium]|uniref:HNH endonuclease n=1 Tax=unclassified Bradyrhizobium TaxID=2631580 RepID=UPI0035C70607